VTADFLDPFSKKRGSASVCESHHETIEMGLSRGRKTMATIMALPATIRPQSALCTSFADPHRCREEAQVYCVGGLMVRDEQSGEYRRTRRFVLTLGRKSVHLLSWRSSARIWAELHEKAFRRRMPLTPSIDLLLMFR
jgi:hypothetical protein